MLDKITYVRASDGREMQASAKMERTLRRAGYAPKSASDIPAEQAQEAEAAGREAAEQAHQDGMETLRKQIMKAESEDDKKEVKALSARLKKMEEAGPDYGAYQD